LKGIPRPTSLPAEEGNGGGKKGGFFKVKIPGQKAETTLEKFGKVSFFFVLFLFCFCFLCYSFSQ